MPLIIQCAGRKNAPHEGLKTLEGRPVKFVAHPDKAPPSADVLFAHPDAPSDRPGKTWRDVVEAINQAKPENGGGMLPAFQLYGPAIYQSMIDVRGVEQVFILSAGWGLVRSDYLLPDYDITFLMQADAYKRRGHRDHYADFNHLHKGDTSPLIFFGGKDYLPLLADLTDEYAGEKRLFYNSANRPDLPGWKAVHFPSARKTNWHYGCAEAFLRGEIPM